MVTMNNTTAAWTVEEMRTIDAVLRDAGRKVIELDDSTEWHGWPDGKPRPGRYAVVSLNASRKLGKRGDYCTDVNAERIVKGERRVQWHRFYGAHDSLASAVAGAIPHTRSSGYADAWHLANARDERERDGRTVEVVAAPQPWVADLVVREPVDRSGKGKAAKRAKVKRAPRKVEAAPVTVDDVRSVDDLDPLDSRRPVDPAGQQWKTHGADCDGYGAIHAPTVKEVTVPAGGGWNAGRVLYQAACLQGCQVGTGHLCGSRETALSMYPKSHSRTDRCDGSCVAETAEPADELEAPAVEVEQPVATVTSITPAKPATSTMGKAERKAANRALAAELRAMGLRPNGDVWERAKQLQAQGLPVTREAVAA